jgi:4'-phosphopantetheinyl transferase
VPASQVYWLQRTGFEVPPTDNWLTETEQSRLSRLKIPKRRADWRLGRWTAKSAVAALQQLEGNNLSFSDIEIQVLDSGAPRASIPAGTISLSVSHRNAVGMCAVSRSQLPLGCDIELVEPRSDAFILDYFSVREQTQLSAVRDRELVQAMATLFWSAKESALKSLELGLRVDLTQLTVFTDCSAISVCSPQLSPADNWQRMAVEVPNHGRLVGWWSQSEEFVRTIVAEASEPREFVTTAVSPRNGCCTATCDCCA